MQILSSDISSVCALIVIGYLYMVLKGLKISQKQTCKYSIIKPLRMIELSSGENVNKKKE